MGNYFETPGMALKLAFRAYCADVATTNPATARHGTTGWTGANMSAMYCPFCGDECTFGHSPDRTLSPVELDELCPNGCMKMPPQVTLRTGDVVDGGTIATFQADGTPIVRPEPALAVHDRVRRLPLDVYQSEGVVESFRSTGHGRPLALVRFAQASYPVLVHQDELVKV